MKFVRSLGTHRVIVLILHNLTLLPATVVTRGGKSGEYKKPKTAALSTISIQGRHNNQQFITSY